MKGEDERLLIDSSQIKICTGCQIIPPEGMIAGGFQIIGLAVVKKGLRMVSGSGPTKSIDPIFLEKKVPFQVVLVRFTPPSNIEAMAE